MPYLNILPATSLQDHIKCFWYAERHFAVNEFFTIYPDGFIEIVFCFSGNALFQTDGQRRRLLPPAFMVGLLDSPLYITTIGKLKTFGIRFFPWGYYSATRKSALADLSGIPNEFQNLAGKLQEYTCKDDPKGGLALIQSTCSQLIHKTPPSECKASKASKLIYAEKGLLRIDSLSRNLFTSPRHLSRLFNKAFGEGLKPYAQQVRFQNIRDRIFEVPTTNLTQLAYEFGYSDQSHFNADFRSFAGKSPGKFAREMRHLRSMLKLYNVRFSQF